ncbi:LOW QUALITY PROTEIN: cadherin-1-like [Prionailurus iriomotensis]
MAGPTCFLLCLSAIQRRCWESLETMVEVEAIVFWEETRR